MDLDLIHTFMELENAGTMGKAAERLHVTQATVSARIALLEETLQQRLFERNKAGTRLTEHGVAFVPYARRLLETWESAQGAMLADVDGRLTLGGEYTLSTSLLSSWLVELRRARPECHLRTEVDTADRLLDGLTSGAIDIVTLYSPLRRSKVKTKLVLKEELVCVSTPRSCNAPTYDEYIYVDWGPDFGAQHERVFPALSRAKTRISLGPLALRFLLRSGGSGYFRRRAVEPYLRTKKLRVLPEMPVFSYSIYAATASSADSELVEWALGALVKAATDVVDPWA